MLHVSARQPGCRGLSRCISHNAHSLPPLQVLADGLASNSSLRDLNVYKCQVGVRAGWPRCAHVARLVTTTANHLPTTYPPPPLNPRAPGAPQIGDAGIIALATSLIDGNSTLETLDIGSNRFGSEAVSTLWLLIRSSKALRVLSMRNRCV